MVVGEKTGKILKKSHRTATVLALAGVAMVPGMDGTAIPLKKALKRVSKAAPALLRMVSCNAGMPDRASVPLRRYQSTYKSVTMPDSTSNAFSRFLKSCLHTNNTTNVRNQTKFNRFAGANCVASRTLSPPGRAEFPRTLARARTCRPLAWQFLAPRRRARFSAPGTAGARVSAV